MAKKHTHKTQIPITLNGVQICWLVNEKEYSAQEVMQINSLRVLFKKCIDNCTNKWQIPIIKDETNG